MTRRPRLSLADIRAYAVIIALGVGVFLAVLTVAVALLTLVFGAR